MELLYDSDVKNMIRGTSLISQLSANPKHLEMIISNGKTFL